MTERLQPTSAEEIERARTDAHELSWALRAVMYANAEVDRALAAHLRLRTLDYEAMDHVMMNPGALGPADLSARLGISTGSATELADRLEAAGHVRRERHPTDRRRVSLAPTEGTVRDVLTALDPLARALDDLAEQFSPEEQEAISRYLRGVEARLHRYAAEVGGA